MTNYPEKIVIEELIKPVVRVRRYREVKLPGVDLQPYAGSVRKLIAEAKRMFRLEVRRKKKLTYKRKYDDNFKGQVLLDYGSDPAYEKWAAKEWAAHFDLMFQKYRKGRRGNPGNNQVHEGGPPLLYLPPVVRLVMKWWKTTLREPFKPDFGKKPYELHRCNAEARLLYLILQDCDPRYKLPNAAGLPRNVLRPRKKANKT